MSDDAAADRPERGVGGDVIRLDLPASLGYLDVLGSCVAEMLSRVAGLRECTALALRIQLAVHEVCANIVDHAYAGLPPGRIAVAFYLSTDRRRFEIEVRDTGRPFDLATVPEPNPAALQERGYGLFLVRNLMDEVTYQSGSEGNVWRLVKYLTAANSHPD